MKTRADGYFYIPNLDVNTLKIESLFNSSLVGDQTGGSSPYPTIGHWPDGIVNMLDFYFMNNLFLVEEGMANWEYMADCRPDRIINMIDVFQAIVNFMNQGNYDEDLSGVIVSFNTGENITPDANGFVLIPQGATSFTVYKSGNPIGALIVFW